MGGIQNRTREKPDRMESNSRGFLFWLDWRFVSRYVFESARSKDWIFKITFNQNTMTHKEEVIKQLKSVNTNITVLGIIVIIFGIIHLL